MLSPFENEVKKKERNDNNRKYENQQRVGHELKIGKLEMNKE